MSNHNRLILADDIGQTLSLSMADKYGVEVRFTWQGNSKGMLLKFAQAKKLRRFLQGDETLTRYIRKQERTAAARKAKAEAVQ